MRAGLFVNGSGAVLVLTSHEKLTDRAFLRKLQTKGIEKFIAFELPIALVQERYGTHYRSVLDDLKQEDDLRVLDFDGRRCFNRFTFAEMGQPTFYEGNRD